MKVGVEQIVPGWKLTVSCMYRVYTYSYKLIIYVIASIKYEAIAMYIDFTLLYVHFP